MPLANSSPILNNSTIPNNILPPHCIPVLDNNMLSRHYRLSLHNIAGLNNIPVLNNILSLNAAPTLNSINVLHLFTLFRLPRSSQFSGLPDAKPFRKTAPGRVVENIFRNVVSQELDAFSYKNGAFPCPFSCGTSDAAWPDSVARGLAQHAGERIGDVTFRHLRAGRVFVFGKSWKKL
jgi:hypothetical protein